MSTEEYSIKIVKILTLVCVMPDGHRTLLEGLSHYKNLKVSPRGQINSFHSLEGEIPFLQPCNFIG